MKHQLWALALAACGLCPVGTVYAQRAVQADFIVALVNSEAITNNDLRAAVALAREQLAAQPPANAARPTNCGKPSWSV